MHKTIRLLLLGVIIIMYFERVLQAVPLTYYQYVTHIERSVFDQNIWFWTPDTMEGPVHSNGTFAIRYSPQFHGPFSTSQDHFIEHQANPRFEVRPVFNAPMVEFPRNLDFLRDIANHRISSRNGENMTWIRMRGDGGIDIFQYPDGSDRLDSLFARYQPLNYWREGMVIFVEGDVEVEGTLAGKVTIGCSGNMYLLDDCVYQGADRNGQFDQGWMPHMLGLASERNIFIANTVRNGRENGYFEDRNNLNRHSIIINGALVALNECFTFEQQNDDWDRYQGPEPDERGRIYLTGSIAQFRKGYTHRSQHQGTGFGKTYHYDFRFLRDGPPGFAPESNGIIDGRYERLELYQRRDYRIRNANIGTLIVHSGVELELEGQQPLVVRDRLIMRGAEDRPITIRPERGGDRTLFRVVRGPHSYVELENVIFEESIETQINCDSLKVINCEFNGPANWEAIIQVTGSKFADEVSMSSWHQLLVTHSVFEDGLTIAGDTRDGHLLNNTIVSGRNSGLHLRRFQNLEIQNNIIAFNRQGINNLHYEEPLLGYNNVFENEVGDYIDCSPGDGSISANPQFVDQRESDYNLNERSPCIDAGSPGSPADLDGTRADIGAFYFDQPNRAPDVFTPANVESFELIGVYPNPFNSSTTIGYYLPVNSNVTIRVFDLAGRLQKSLINSERDAGSHEIEWNPKSFSAGMYLLQMQAGEFSALQKMMLLK